MEVTARVKAAGAADGLADGQFVALVSVFNNEDSYGDVVRPGAFTQTLQEWAASGDSIPVIWAHQWSDPFAHIGRVVKAVETLQGLEVTGQIDDLDGDDPNPTARQVYRLLKGRRVKQFSFAYDVAEGGWIKDDEHPWGGYFELRRLDLHEVGPCLLGVNRETELLAAKAANLAAGAKAGRVLSQKNFDTLTAAYESIGEVLAAAAPEPDKARGPAAPKKNTPAEETGQPGSAAASGTTPPAQPSEPAPAQDAPEDTTPSSTEDETTPGPREASEDAAKAGAVAARLRTDLELLELEAALTE
ncbi:HK97 family phage prohead protease [Streptomyces longwoodensis]|uniref:HK97 family phage prohead protease n=1 Tax=Streptomyces longwoodensis TaxID=68231 RepID=UPI0022588118|nr:HK97 family phage prohead protease [Streptomyces longwoodensis]MCX4993845.1 HK97 family phage prohead protease [Streptomyces longwoodensis]MCX4998035.1 HK97 family phage prohead protease [Streptomyces longwoodensis]